jgi:hypothetical protein
MSRRVSAAEHRKAEHQNRLRVFSQKGANMRASTAYFAGAGTVIAAIVGGVGGGFLMADIIHPKPAKQGTEMTRLERHLAPQPIQAAPGPLEPVQYLATPQPSAAAGAAPAQPQPQTETAGSESARAQPAETTAAATQPQVPAPQPATVAAQPVAQGQAAAPENAIAKARDADLKRAVEKRKLERRQQWAERRWQRQQQELKAVEERVREETESSQVFAAEPVRIEMPQVRLFGPE